MNRNLHICILGLVFLLVGCKKDKVGENVHLYFDSNIEASNMPSKAAITSLNFPEGALAGLVFLKGNSTTEPYLSGYENIEATAFNSTGIEWRYRYNNSSIIVSSIALLVANDVIDVYGYYPYDNRIFASDNIYGITKIPFEIDSKQNDYMWTGKTVVNTSSAVNYELKTTLTYKHIMTLLTFRIKQAQPSSLKLTSITLSTPNNNTVKLKSKGEYDATNGSIITSQDAVGDSLRFTFNQAISINEFDANIILTPMLLNSNEDLSSLIVKFEFDGRTLIGGKTFKINLNDAKFDYEGSTQYGFIHGVRYIYTLEIDNEMKFNNYPTFGEWNTEDVLIDI